MSQGYLWLVIVGMGLLTVALRLSFIGLSRRWATPPLFERALRFVPSSVLAALVFPALLVKDADIYLGLGNHALLAGLLAALVAWRSHNVLYTIMVGMTALWLLQLVF